MRFPVLTPSGHWSLLPVALLRAGLLLLGVVCAAPVQAKIEVEISGIGGGEKENVEARLGIRAASGQADLDQLLVDGLHARAEGEIREALQPFGFYNPEIESRLEGEAPNWKAYYQVTLGPPTILSEIDVRVEGEGSEEEVFRREFRRFPMRKDQRVIHADYEEVKTRFATAAYAQGYLDARYTRSELRIDPVRHTAEVHLTLETGPRYYFGPVRVDQDILNAGVAERYVRIEPGKPFDPQMVLETQFALTDLEYFQSVEIEPQRAEVVDQHIPILIRTTPRAKRKWDFGVGYGTDTGARVSAGTEVRRLNRDGHKLRLDTRFSEIKNTVSGEYRIPLGSRPGEYWGFGGASETERYDDGESLKYVLSTSLNRNNGDWQRKLYLNYEHEETELSDLVRTSDLLIPGLTLSRSELNDEIHARRGWSLYTDLHGAQKEILASASFMQTHTILRGVLPYKRRGRVLLRGEYGANLVADFDELPASQRFFAGGDQSVRGYSYQSLGPKDDQGNVVGGKYLATFSIETDYFFWKNWGLAAFYDAGGADDDTMPRLYQGIGAGLRYRAPVGFIQIDLAHPLDGDASGLRLHFGVRVGL